MNWNVIGHEWVVAYVQRSIAAGRDSHAYLISGPEGIGKSLLAVRLAQALNCETYPDKPCLECRACRRIERGNHPDVRLVSLETQAAALKSSQTSRSKDLKIDTIREWQRDIALKPYEGRRRVFILLDAERLTEEASNAMLKTLEEPPPFATLILVAHSANLLSTIVSRCQHIRLRTLPRQQIVDTLVSHAGIDAEQATLIAAWSGGKIGWALNMVDAPDEMQTYQERLDTLMTLPTQSCSMAFRWAEDRTKEYRAGEHDAVYAWLELWRSWWHDVLLVAAGCPEYIMHVNRRGDLDREAQRYALSDIYRFVAQVSECVQQLRDNVNPQLALENLFLHVPHTA